MLRFASEDVGLADPQALVQALAAFQTVERVGMPEAELALAQAAVYLALAPKSNAATIAYEAAKRDVREERTYPVPLHLRNAPTPLMRDLKHGEEYLYPHDHPGAVVAQTYFPPELADRRYYRPTDRGLELELARRRDWIDRFRRARTLIDRGAGEEVREPDSARSEAAKPPREGVSAAGIEEDAP
jgi:putative ATPase